MKPAAPVTRTRLLFMRRGRAGRFERPSRCGRARAWRRAGWALGRGLGGWSGGRCLRRVCGGSRRRWWRRSRPRRRPASPDPDRGFPGGCRGGEAGGGPVFWMARVTQSPRASSMSGWRDQAGGVAAWCRTASGCQTMRPGVAAAAWAARSQVSQQRSAGSRKARWAPVARVAARLRAAAVWGCPEGGSVRWTGRSGARERRRPGGWSKRGRRRRGGWRRCPSCGVLAGGAVDEGGLQGGEESGEDRVAGVRGEGGVEFGQRAPVRAGREGIRDGDGGAGGFQDEEAGLGGIERGEGGVESMWAAGRRWRGRVVSER